MLLNGVHTERNRDNKTRKTFDLTKIDKRDVVGSGSLESLVVGTSAKKRQPTMMPFNLPGDGLDYIEKNED